MVDRATLRPDYTISRIIKGGWQLAGGHGAVDRAEATGDMLAFVDAGITTFDCADIYTGVEEMIGDFVTELRTARGAAAVDAVQIHTKLVPDLDKLDSFNAADVEAIVDRSLRRLRVDRLSMVQFFWWDMSRGRPSEVLSHLSTLQARGKIDQLGCTNFDERDMAAFASAGLDIASAQVQYSVLDARPAGAFDSWCAAHDVAILCYGTLAGGFLTDDWLGKPDPGFAFENRSLTKYRLIIDEFGGWDLFQELLRTLSGSAQKHGVSLSSVACRWVLDQPQVAAAIVGARTARSLPDTLQAEALRLDTDDHDAIRRVLDQRKGPQGPVYALEGDRNGRHGRIMKYNLGQPA